MPPDHSNDDNRVWSMIITNTVMKCHQNEKRNVTITAAITICTFTIHLRLTHNGLKFPAELSFNCCITNVNTVITLYQIVHYCSCSTFQVSYQYCYTIYIIGRSVNAQFPGPENHPTLRTPSIFGAPKTIIKTLLSMMTMLNDYQKCQRVMMMITGLTGWLQHYKWCCLLWNVPLSYNDKIRQFSGMKSVMTATVCHIHLHW